MPRREDERQFNLAGKHPEACTCQDCTDKFLGRKKIRPARKIIFGPRNKPGEQTTRHPKGCACSSCNLLGTLENLPKLDRGPGGLLKRLFGKR